MKSFQNFANTILEAEVPDKPKIRISGPEILPMQPEVGTDKPKVKKTKVVKQAQVSADIKASAAEKKRLEGIKKGYISPEGRVQERGVVTNRIRASALGYGDPGKDPSKYGINPANVSAEKRTLFQRASSSIRAERRAARSEIKKGVKSIVKNYPVQSGTSFRGFSRSVSQTPPSRSDISTLHRMARPETSGKSAAALSGQLGTGAGRRAQAASDAAKDIANYEKNRAYHQRILKAIDKLPPETSTPSTPKTTPAAPKPTLTPTPAAQKPLPKLNLDKYKVKPLDPIKPVIATSRNYKPVATAAQKPLSSDKIADAVVKASKQVRLDISAEKAAERSKIMKGLGTAGKVLGAVQTGIEAKKGYDIAKAMGSSEKRSLGAGAARALGTAAGGVVGGVLGSVAGPIGSAAGAAAGVTVGAQLGSRAYDAITGDPKKKVTTQGVLTNIRKAVPQEIRAQVPANLRKGFTDFVKSAGRTYGNWQRSQQGENK